MKVQTLRNKFSSIVINHYLMIIICFYIIVGFFSKILHTYSDPFFLLWIFFVILLSLWITRKLKSSISFLLEIGIVCSKESIILTLLGIFVVGLVKVKIETINYSMFIIMLGVVIEELVFRIILPCFVLKKYRITNKFGLITISSLLFTIIHIPSHSIQFLIGLFFTSCILTMIAIRYRTIILGLILHSFANSGLVSVIILVFGYYTLCLINPHKNNKYSIC